MVMLMVFSTVLIVAKQLWDANTFYDSLLAATQNAQVAQQHYEAYLTQVVWQTALLIVVFCGFTVGRRTRNAAPNSVSQ